MKTKSIKVVVIEQQHYYSQLISEEINELRSNKSLANLKFEIESVENQTKKIPELVSYAVMAFELGV